MTVADHLTLSELEQRVKKAGDPVEKARFLAVYHAKRGLTAKEIGKITLHSTRWVQQVVRRYNQEGPEALNDRRHHNPGQRPKLTPERSGSWRRCRAPHPMGACGPGPSCGPGWSGNWERSSPSTPSTAFCTRWASVYGSPALSTGSGRRKRRWRSKKLLGEAEEARRKGRRVRLLAYDEHRLGLKPVYRRVWSRKGERPKAVVAHRYEWFYVCTFVEPKTGWNLSLLVDGMDTQVMRWVLQDRGYPV